jgi:hypothetical protein
MARAIEQDDAAVRSQPLAKGDAQVVEIAAGAVDHHDRKLLVAA